MARFKLYIEYEGTRYSGWQMQKNAKTIQGKLYEAGENVFKKERFDLYGSGRTDGGVHALCQVAHLEVKTMLAPEIIRLKINDELPSDINIIEVVKAQPKFHARYDAKNRSYLYQISRRRSAFGKLYTWWIKDQLNFSAMNKAARQFVGMHDFTSFAERDDEEKSTKVLISDVQLKEEGDLILFRVTGSHFLWKQVRRMVGVLAEIGRGNLKEADLKNFLETKSSEPSKYTAPPSGLFLEKVYYDKNESIPPMKSVINMESYTKSLM